ncbi:MAG: hypothetical protein ACYS9Y_13920 [Planctomycetota bacterium]|jgi:hypothetical protein
MSWNLFERIINAFRPAGKAPEPQSWPESSADQPKNEQQQTSQAEDMLASTQQNEPSGQDSKQRNW